MKRISVFKSICWFIVCSALFLILNEIAYSISFSLLGVLIEHIRIVRAVLNVPILLQLSILLISLSYGYYCALISYLILPKKSPNVGKGYIGSGILLIIWGIISVILSALADNFLLIGAEVLGGVMFIYYGKAIDDANNNGELDNI